MDHGLGTDLSDDTDLVYSTMKILIYVYLNRSSKSPDFDILHALNFTMARSGERLKRNGSMP